jgi:hypothetical protein
MSSLKVKVEYHVHKAKPNEFLIIVRLSKPSPNQQELIIDSSLPSLAPAGKALRNH